MRADLPQPPPDVGEEPLALTREDLPKKEEGVDAELSGGSLGDSKVRMPGVGGCFF